MAPNAEVARLLADFPAEEARALFLQGATASRLARDGPDNLVSLQGFFTRRPVEVTEALLAEISADGPGVSLEDIRGIDKPTLVLGHGRDAIHPLAYAETLASMIRGARLVVITAKADDRRRYVQDFRDALHEFLVPLC